MFPRKLFNEEHGMRFANKITGSLIVALVMLVASLNTASAAVLYDQLDVQTLSGDAGISSMGGVLTMDGTAFSITTTSGPIDIPDEDFSLSASYSGSSGIAHIFSGGSLSIGSLLTAVFDNLTIYSLGGGMGAFAADLTYTGGSLAGSFTVGRIEGTFFGATTGDFSGDFAAGSMISSVGQVVVPIPAAFLLFGSGLIALFGVARRRKL